MNRRTAVFLWLRCQSVVCLLRFFTSLSFAPIMLGSRPLLTVLVVPSATYLVLGSVLWLSAGRLARWIDRRSSSLEVTGSACLGVMLLVSTLDQMILNLALRSDRYMRLSSERELGANALIVAAGVLLLLLPVARQQRNNT